MILENRCHGIRPWNRFTVRVQSEMLSSNSRSGASFFIAHARRLIVCLWVTTTLVSWTPVKNCRFFTLGWAHDLEMKQPVRRDMQLATLKTTNESPSISSHRSYTRQTKEVKNFASFVIPISKKVMAVVLGTAKNIRTASQVTKQCSVRNALTTKPSPSETRGKPFSIGRRKSSFDFVRPCQSTSCERKCASSVNGIGPSIDVWYFCKLRSLPTISCNLTLTVVCVPIENVRQCRKWIVDLHKRSLVVLYEKNSKPVRSRGLELYLA